MYAGCFGSLVDCLQQNLSIVSFLFDILDFFLGGFIGFMLGFVLLMMS